MLFIVPLVFVCTRGLWICMRLFARVWLCVSSAEMFMEQTVCVCVFCVEGSGASLTKKYCGGVMVQ